MLSLLIKIKLLHGSWIFKWIPVFHNQVGLSIFELFRHFSYLLQFVGSFMVLKTPSRISGFQRRNWFIKIPNIAQVMITNCFSLTVWFASTCFKTFSLISWVRVDQFLYRNREIVSAMYKAIIIFTKVGSVPV